MILKHLRSLNFKISSWTLEGKHRQSARMAQAMRSLFLLTDGPLEVHLYQGIVTVEDIIKYLVAVSGPRLTKLEVECDVGPYNKDAITRLVCAVERNSTYMESLIFNGTPLVHVKAPWDWYRLSTRIKVLENRNRRIQKRVADAKRYACSPTGILLNGRPFAPRRRSLLLELPTELRLMILEYL